MTILDLCQLLYPIPDPWNALEDNKRFQHQDLASLSRAELLREQQRLKLRLLLDDMPDQWLFGRLEALRKVVGDAR